MKPFPTPKFLATFITLVLLLSCNGCSALSQKIGDYIETATAASLERKINAKLSPYNLSIAELESAVFTGGSLDPEAAKDLGKGLLLLEAQKIVKQHVDTSHKILADKSSSEISHLWNWLLGGLGTSILGLIGKILHAAMKNKAFEERLKVLEAGLGLKPEPEASDTTETED